MSDTPAITQLIATVQYSAKVPTEVRYANREAGLFLQVDVTGLSSGEAEVAIKDAYDLIKALVEEQVTQPEAAAVAIVQNEFPGGQVERGVKAQTNTNLVGTIHTAKDENACAQCGGTKFEDFRKVTEINGKPKAARFPDFKCLGEFQGKPCGKGVWLTKKPVSA